MNQIHLLKVAQDQIQTRDHKKAVQVILVEALQVVVLVYLVSVLTSAAVIHTIEEAVHQAAHRILKKITGVDLIQEADPNLKLILKLKADQMHLQ